MQRYEDLATSPSHVVSRKVANWRGNAGKVKRDELNKEVAAAHGVEYKNVLGNKRTYKPLAPEVEEGNEDTSGMKTPLDIQSGFSGSKRKRDADDDGVEGDFDPTSSKRASTLLHLTAPLTFSAPSKDGRKVATPSANKRAKSTTVVAGPDN